MPRPRRLRALLLVCLLAVLGPVVLAGPVGAQPGMRTLRYLGATVRVPAGWPVVSLAAHPDTCVAFDRHAVYLGAPSAAERCGAGVRLGRSEAILVAPAWAPVGVYGPQVLVRREGRARVTATWGRAPAVVAAALGLARVRGSVAPAAPAAPARIGGAMRSPRRVSSATPAAPGGTFTGEGFDTCATPSPAAMSAWGSSSPYGAVGIYLGGQNMACSQPNLTPSWVSTESSAGWHLVPTYVGLQAPSNSCGCAAMTASAATSEGTAAAQDAVADAKALGLGPGNPIYDDMEGYSRGSANSVPVLAFLKAWTLELHTLGYVSGVYSSESSGIADLTAQQGTGYPEPDDVWIAAWNGQASTADPSVPNADWPDHQRLHQYEGASNQTYGGTTLNVDQDYLDGATAGYGSGGATAPTTAPVASAAPTIVGPPVVGQTLTVSHATWSGSPSAYAEQWSSCPPLGGGCAAIPGATGATFTVPADLAGATLEVSETAGNAVGAGQPVTSAQTVAVDRHIEGFWALTATGAVIPSAYELSWGAPAGGGPATYVGITGSGYGSHGYWVVTRWGIVDAFGSAAVRPRIAVAHPVLGIVRSPGRTGGYWLYTAAGNVYPSRGTPFYGSAARAHRTDIVGMASLPNAPGYWLVTSHGTVLAFGHAPVHPAIHPVHPVVGIVAAPNHGYWLYTAQGDVYPSRGAPYYGAPHGSGVVSMLATPDGRGYWLISATGLVSAYGDAGRYPQPALGAGTVVGLAG